MVQLETLISQEMNEDDVLALVAVLLFIFPLFVFGISACCCCCCVIADPGFKTERVSQPCFVLLHFSEFPSGKRASQHAQTREEESPAASH